MMGTFNWLINNQKNLLWQRCFKDTTTDSATIRQKEKICGIINKHAFPFYDSQDPGKQFQKSEFWNLGPHLRRIAGTRLC